MNGKRLKQAREKAGHTQESLAELVGIHVRNLTRYENGSVQPSADSLAKIAHALGVSLDYLVDLSESPSPLTELTQTEKRAVGAWRHKRSYQSYCERR